MEQDKTLWHRWDHAWKIFLSPNYPWHKQFIAWLLGTNYVDYLVDLDSLKFAPEDPSVLNSRDVTYADCILSCEVDNVAKKLHFEFQSTYDKSIAFRSLQYQLGHIISSVADKSGEIYHLPDSVVVAVKPGFSYASPRTLELHLNGKSFKVEYPVVYGYKVIPGLNAVMSARDDNAWITATRDFLKLLKVPRDDSLVRDECLYACRLLADERAYSDKGVEEDEVMKNMPDMVEEFKTIEEWAEERGRVAQEFEDRTSTEAMLQRWGVPQEMVERMMNGEEPDVDFSVLIEAAKNVRSPRGTKPVGPLKYDGRK